MTERITRDEMLMGIAWLASQRGTCSRLHVGAIVSRDGRIIATGYNGSPAGLPHCSHECNCGSTDKYGDVILPHSHNCGLLAPCEVAEHAERNLIAFSAKHGMKLDGSELHVTHAPCLACARSIINAGIVRVTFDTEYRLTAGVELLQTAGIALQHLKLVR